MAPLMSDTPKTPAVHLRKIRSFVKRPGRLTAAQSRALSDLLPRFGVAADVGAPLGRRDPAGPAHEAADFSQMDRGHVERFEWVMAKGLTDRRAVRWNDKATHPNPLPHQAERLRAYSLQDTRFD